VPVYKTYDSIEQALKRFNERAYNAGLSFRVTDTDNQYAWIDASFDFAYYVNVRIEFHEVLYTNLKVGQSWPDAWHSDQIFLLTPEEIQEHARLNNIARTEEDIVGVCFKISDNGNRNLAVVIFKSLEINWIHPAHED
jgi:hypothetical protein